LTQLFRPLGDSLTFKLAGKVTLSEVDKSDNRGILLLRTDSKRGDREMKRLLGVLFAVVLMFSLAVSPSAVHAASFTVTNINDSGPGSLRQAILDANASPGTDTIDFNITGVGPHTIQPTSALPTITDPVIIDGYTQPGASPNTNGPGLGSNAVLKIELDGKMAGMDIDGLKITAGNSTVRGLVINQFTGDFGQGINLQTNGGNVVEGNFLGTDVTGTLALGNGRSGVNIYGISQGNTIGGTTAGARNVISGNGAGVWITSWPGNLVQGNFIGTDATGTADLGNTWDGVILDGNAAGNTIGGTTAGARNVISGNNRFGVHVGGSVTGNLVQGNFIGTDVTGTANVGNSFSGVRVLFASNNTIGGMASGAGNVIAFNGIHGISLYGSSNNLIKGNKVADNRYGVYLEDGANDNQVIKNKLADNDWGIVLGGANDNEVIKNKVAGSTYYGISSVVGATGNLIQKNKVSGSGTYDLHWDGSGSGNTWEKNKYETANF